MRIESARSSAAKSLPSCRFLGADLQYRCLVEWVDIERARAKLELESVLGAPPISRLRPRPWEAFPFLGRPLVPEERVGIRDFVVEYERSLRLEIAPESAERFLILCAAAAQAEDATGHDRRVRARRSELVKRLHEERRVEPLAPGFRPAERDHVGGHIVAVDIETVTKPRKQQPAGTASGVERRLPSRDEASEILDFLGLGRKLGPPLGNQAVVPCLRVAHRGFSSVSAQLPRVARSGPQLGGVHDPEVRSLHAVQGVQLAVVPALVGGARDVPARAVVGHDHPVALQRGGLRAPGRGSSTPGSSSAGGGEDPWAGDCGWSSSRRSAGRGRCTPVANAPL
jgi:hypothetical protein